MPKHTVESADLYYVVVDEPTRFSFGTWDHRIHAFIRLAAAGTVGWGESTLPSTGSTISSDLNRVETAMDVGRELLGLSVDAAMYLLASRRELWPAPIVEAYELAMIDIAARLNEVSALTYLGLNDRTPLPGVYCILDDRLEFISKKVERGLSLGLTSHHKVKLFGEIGLDEQIVRAARDIAGDAVFLIGDANRGYGYRESGVNAPIIRESLARLAAVGLSAAEDPAEFSHAEWRKARAELSPLELVMDRGIRPAWEGVHVVEHALADAYNIHPACMRSIRAVVDLASAIHLSGAKLMIGDNSFVGPGCPQWQQIAIGAGADWCEAVEKPWDSDVFRQVCTVNPVQRHDSTLSLTHEPEGFGIEIDAPLLRDLAYSHRTLNC